MHSARLSLARVRLLGFALWRGERIIFNFALEMLFALHSSIVWLAKDFFFRRCLAAGPNLTFLPSARRDGEKSFLSLNSLDDLVNFSAA
jgi:hypothetical protein